MRSAFCACRQTYRKLEVRGKIAAVAEAKKRGLI